MATVWMFEHQAAGLITEFVFAAPPTSAQRDQTWERMSQKYGEMHPKYRDPAHENHGQRYTLEAREFEVLDSGAVVPRLSDTKPAGPQVVEIRAPHYGVKTEGEVRNP